MRLLTFFITRSTTFPLQEVTDEDSINAAIQHTTDRQEERFGNLDLKAEKTPPLVTKTPAPKPSGSNKQPADLLAQGEMTHRKRRLIVHIS